MLSELGEGQAAEQPPASASETSHAELLRGSQAAGTASEFELAASDAARPVQQGERLMPAVAAVAQGPKLWLRHYMVAVDVGPEAYSR